jgi:hypothetical protein
MTADFAAHADPERAASHRAASPGAEPDRPGPESSDGRPLPTPDRSLWQARLGVPLGDVRVHQDARAARAADTMSADGFTRGSHIYLGGGLRLGAPSSERLLAHELAHVVQQRGSGPPDPVAVLEREAEEVAAGVASGRQAPVRGTSRPGALHRRSRSQVPRVDPHTRLNRLSGQIRSQALTDWVRAVDGVDPEAVAQAGELLLALWQATLGAREALLPPESIRAVEPADPPAFTEIRDEILVALPLQRFRGEDLIGPPRRVEHVVDVGRFIATQSTEAVATIRDARQLVATLGRRPVSPDDQDAAVRILAGRPNPWQFAYLRAVLRGEGLEHVLAGFGLVTALNLRAVLASQEFLSRRESLGPADRVGLVEPLPRDRKVRVLRPSAAQDLALDLYGDYSFHETVLVPYNRSVFEGRVASDLIAAGTELLVEPALLHGRYRLVFMAVELTRRQSGGPYIEPASAGAAILGTTTKYTLRLPAPQPDPLRPAGMLTISLAQLTSWVELEWLVRNDPATVGLRGIPEQESLGYRAVTTDELAGAGAVVARSWTALGTHLLVAQIKLPESPWHSEPLELHYPQAVVTPREKLEADWPLVDDPRIDSGQVFARPAETYGDFQRIAAELGVSEDDLAHDPRLAGQVRTWYYPEFLLRDLRRQLSEPATTPGRRRKLRYQVDSVEQAIRQTKTWGLRPVRALYVSAAGERSTSIPLTLYLTPDPEAARAFPWALALWDFTMEGGGRQYTDGHGAGNPTDAVHGVLDAFGGDAPYPTGTVRFVIEPVLLPAEFTSGYTLVREVYEVHTRGGSPVSKIAGGVLMVAALTVGALTLGPGVTLTAFAIYGAFTGMIDIVERLEAGTFEWDLQTGLDILAIAGGISGGLAPMISVVRGVGAVAWLGDIAKVTGVLQVGVMIGQHSRRLVAAAQSGNGDEILDALLAAAVDGALIVVTHKIGQMAPEGTARSRPSLPQIGFREATRPVTEPAGRPSTAAGVGSGEPPAAGGPAEAAPSKPPAAHGEWVSGMAERGLGPRPGPGAPAGPKVGAGTYEAVDGRRSFSSPDTAFAAYDEAAARAGDREVGIFMRKGGGEYVVKVGDQHSVPSPGEGWESVLHRHPNPENVLTRRMPAPQDVQKTMHSAARNGHPVSEFIEYPLPDGRRGLVAYTVEPQGGRVKIRYQRADGVVVERAFASIEDYARHYGERTTYVDPAGPEYRWMIQDLHEFYSDAPWSEAATARGTLKPGARSPGGGPAAAEPAAAPPGEARQAAGRRAPARTRAQLERATQAIEQRLTELESHPDAPAMANELDLIRHQLREGRDADAASRIIALERRMARALLYRAQSGLSTIYGETEQVIGARVIQYVPQAEGPPLRLDPTTPHPLDATGQKLLAHVRAAIPLAEAEGFTEAELAALRTVERGQRSSLRDAYRGSHIDRIAKRAVMEDPELGHVLVTVNFEQGADFYDSRTGYWYDMTTTGQWKAHVAKYGPTVPGYVTVPGFRLPTEIR